MQAQTNAVKKFKGFSYFSQNKLSNKFCYFLDGQVSFSTFQG